MSLNIIFVVLTFIIILAVVIIAEDLSTAVLTVSLLASMLAISIHFGNISKNALGMTAIQPGASYDRYARPFLGQYQTGISQNEYMTGSNTIHHGPQNERNKAPPHSDDPTSNIPFKREYINQPTAPYGPFYEGYHAYNTSYTGCYNEPRLPVGSNCAEVSNDFDANNAQVWQRRARDRKCSDGWATKDANYYGYHYGWELDESENKPWWGNNEY